MSSGLTHGSPQAPRWQWVRATGVAMTALFAFALANVWLVFEAPGHLGYPAGGSMLLSTLPVLTLTLLVRAVAGFGMALSPRVPTLPVAVTGLGLLGLSLANGWAYVLCVSAV